ncbi:sodium- and chloride-dependent glycine transporter 2-like [Haliotis rufescens]|uniref:sodium- and chloride-dependent glycine transporter 2-like n=1 Tax=Haliotis rufescens TaxID=6454 RepID=UPI001EB00248|nr:sodium- and chloride-dependent glycine transporter 2-like [Haliotis rufescens]XP_046367894.1 sodium- and chloride-dependent glycine transporter 2-like [Haliotis rufescens]XP_046367895.1 sodium- and chloride-dependent glycine transporter 2-like [Haliotis rufescens]
MGGEIWSHQLDYFLTLMGYTVGVGSIWKFPYMCARNGGGSFLIPFIIFTLLGSVPLTYLEMFVGQYSRGGPISAWKICPPLRGVGLGSVMISWLFAIYYPVFFAWILYYLYFSFFPTLPWTQCNQEWNTQNCVDGTSHINRTLTAYNSTALHSNFSDYGIKTTLGRLTNLSTGNESHVEISASEEFFRNQVLDISDGVENMGTLRWPLIGCLAVTFLSVYLCLLNGVKLSGKIVYVTVSCPYILILVFLVRSSSLPGAVDGVMFFIMPHFEKLIDPKVWMEALGLSLYQMGISYGFLITMAAHNPVNNNCFRDALFITVITLLSQIFFGFAVFCITGHVAFKRDVPIEHFQTSGFKLGFITYPEAASYLPLPQLWSVFLFVMLYTLGIDSLVPSYEVVTNMFSEWFPNFARRRWLLNACVLFPSFLLALPYMTQGGVYFLTLVEWYAFFPAIILFAMLECVVVGWIYGVKRIDKAMVLLWGKHLSPIISFLWRFACPILLAVMFAFSLYSYHPPQFEEYNFPPWAKWFGWLISVATVIPTPILLIHSVYTAPGDSLREKIRIAFQPKHRWATHDPDTDEDGTTPTTIELIAKT